MSASARSPFARSGRNDVPHVGSNLYNPTTCLSFQALASASTKSRDKSVRAVWERYTARPTVA